MEYYIICKKVFDINTGKFYKDILEDLFIVDNKEVAEDYCKKSEQLTYREVKIETKDINPSYNEALETLFKARQVCDASCVAMCNHCQKRSAYDYIKQLFTKKDFEEVLKDE